MTIQGLLAHLQTTDVRLRARDGELIVSAQREQVDAPLLEELRIHKAALLAMIGEATDGWWRPSELRPDAFPLADLNQEEIDRIVARVPGGAANVQDIYPLAPLQEGVFFHHLLQTEGDPYLLGGVLRFDGRERVDAYLTALRAVIARHDILRTAIAWEGLREPVQVVWREAPLKVEEVVFDAADGPVAEQLVACFNPRQRRIDLHDAPLMRVYLACDPEASCWFVLLLRHHLVSDHTTQGLLWREIRAHLAGRADRLPQPVPFRHYVAQARLGVSQEEHAVFFRTLLADVTEPTAPFGLLDVWGDGSDIEEARLEVEPELVLRIRERARRLGVSAASLSHLAWAQVLARASGREDVVFGTVLAGRMGGGQDAAYGLGMFINTLPVRGHIGDEGAEASVRRMHTLLADLLRHEHASLALAQRCSGVPAPTPLFTSLFNHRHVASVKGASKMPESWAASSEAWAGISKVASQERTNYPLTVSVDDAADGFRIDAQAPASIDPARVCAFMHTALRSLVEALDTEPQRALRSLDVLPAEERARVVPAWNATDRVYSSDRCLHERFEAQVEQQPDAVAVACDDGQFTYADVNRRANQLAHHLRRRCVGPEVCVALCLERSLELVVAVLAVLKAGGAYVPLDPSYPAERLAYVLRDSGVRLLLTESGLRGRVAPSAAADDGIEVLSLDSLRDAIAREPADNPAARTPTNALAYVIYTSGSTGRPKGVLVTHANVTRLFAATAEWFDFDERDVWTLFHSIAFDFSVWELWGALLHGGRLVVVPVLTSRTPEACYALLLREGITVLNQTPSAFRQLIQVEEDSGGASELSLRLVIFGGEALEMSSLAPWYSRHGDGGPQLVNMYGITETTVHVTYQPLQADAVNGPSVIGGPIPDLQVYLLDPHGAPVPIGVLGELHVGGAGLARGYLRRPGLTAERFVADAVSGRAGARLYRTGDIGRWRTDGTIEFLGRNDHQVKVRGYRIELGETEAGLRNHPAVRDAVVIARDDRHGGKQLVAYYVAAAAIDAEELRAHLSRHLPEPMVPAAYVRLESMPLTAHGKFDRDALPAPAGDAFASRSCEPPLGEIENALAGLWADVLGVERVGRHDNFFALGGHSLLAVRLIGRMRQARLHADVRVLFAAPTLAGLAAEVRRESLEVAVPPNRISTGCGAITPDLLPLVALNQGEIDRIVSVVEGGPANVQDIYPLAPLQEGILFHHLVDTEADPYVVMALLAFDDRALLNKYVAAVQSVVARHDLLRTAVMWEGLREPVQVVWRKVRVPVEEIELNADDGDVGDQLKRHVDPRHYRLDIRRAPLIRIFIAWDARQQRWMLLRLQHHLIADHLAGEVLHAEIRAHLLGRADQLAPALPFRDYVARYRLGVSRDEHVAFFTRLLGDVEEPTAPFGLLDVRGDGSRVEAATLAVERGLSTRLRVCARALGVSAASICHVAFALMLARVSGRRDVVFGTVLFGRMQGGEGAERAMGLFINTLPVRVRVGDAPAAASVRQTHDLLAELLRHEHAPLALVQRCSQVESLTPLFSALFNYRHSGKPRARAPEARATASGITVVASEERSNYPLGVSVDDLGQGFRIAAHVHASVSPVRVCALMHAALQSLVESLDTVPDRALESLDVLPPSERKTVVAAWNATAVAYPDHACLHTLFEAQVTERPDAVALSCGDQSLTYAELNARANRLARALIEHGVAPDARVAICLEPSLEMVVGVLAVLKAGGAYVPLDPSYPPSRLAYMLRDCAPVALLTQQFLGAVVGETDVPVIHLDRDTANWEAYPATNLAIANLTSDHLAYVIYTSGSTGQPKGVMITHRGIGNVATTQTAAFRVTPESRVLQFASFSFDACAFDLAVALSGGAALHLPDRTIPLAGQPLSNVVRDHQITHALLPPGIPATLPDDGALASMHVMIVGGDVVPAAVTKRWAPGRRLVNAYGPTEATILASSHLCDGDAVGNPPIGRPIANARIYIRDDAGEPVPVGVLGELYVGGVGVARGYLGRPALTADRFVPDPFGGEAGGRLYRTGDVARWRTDGTIEFQGRNDDQVKVRGFRIELGEIQARLGGHAGVRDAVVVAADGPDGSKRLVAYWVGAEDLDVDALRRHLAQALPEYMVPSAFVRLAALPLTQNGKLDRRALPAPESRDLARAYVAPIGETETALAAIWSEVLGVERVSRNDHFFELGGHSLLVVTVTERMRQQGLHADVRALFTTPTLAALAADVRKEGPERAAVPNRIPPGCVAITPEMLPLVALHQAEIDTIVSGVEGGAANVQDIYPLSPLQEGILFHHLAEEERDPYALASVTRFASRGRLDAFLAALQAVIARNDILRTSLAWQGLREPVQIVWRRARLYVEELHGEGAAQQLRNRFTRRSDRIDVRRAPMLRVCTAPDATGKGWLSLLLMHHLVGDHTTLDVIRSEIQAHLLGTEDTLPTPLPFRNFVAQSRQEVPRAEHETFFRALLRDVSETTAPFGLLDIRWDGSGIAESRLAVDESLATRVRACARNLGVSVASLFHVAWAQVLARASGTTDVVFGTVLIGRMNAGEGADRVMGLFMNTLPVRIRVRDGSAEATVRRAHALLADLLRHEHASLRLAQRCSGVVAPAPLFTSLFNYRHSTRRRARSSEARAATAGMDVLSVDQRSHYPLAMSVDDLGDGFSLQAQVQAPITPARVCALLHTGLDVLVQALEGEPARAIGSLDVLPAAELAQMVAWNGTDRAYPSAARVHELFEMGAAQHPDAVAAACGDCVLTYSALNARANQVSRHLLTRGVTAEARVAIVLPRSIELVIAELGVLKAGAAYVPIDPTVPVARRQFIAADSGSRLLLTRTGEPLPALAAVERIDIDRLPTTAAPETPIGTLGAGATAYVMYTSGSTGQPKGVLVPHRAITRLVVNNGYAAFGADDRVACAANVAFDATTMEVWGALLNGGCVVMIEPDVVLDHQRFGAELQRQDVTALWLTAGLFHQYADALPEVWSRLRWLIVGGEALDSDVIARVLRLSPPARLLNGYGPTETTTFALTHEIEHVPAGAHAIPLGRPIGNARVYITDDRGEPVPIGAAGELWIGGAGVATGYAGRPALTAERFVPDSFSGVPGERLYRTGDRGRWLPEGIVEFLGRMDDQVKIRGFRVEPGEVEARLREHEGVREAVVVARADARGENRLMAYWVGDEPLDAETLRTYLAERLPEYMVPVTYLRLDEVPLTPNGKVDRRALPAAAAARAFATDQAPAVGVESIIADAWSEALGVSCVARHDDFFALGGHSLSAVRVLDRLRRSGIQLQVSDLFASPTVASLAARVTKLVDPIAGDAAIPLRSTGSQRPLFLVHDGLGAVDYAQLLTGHLGETMPVYALPPSGVVTDCPTIEAMSERLVRLIRAAQPSGPYRIAGWSFGGLLAYETAAQLLADGDVLEFVGLIDATPPSRSGWQDEPADPIPAAKPIQSQGEAAPSRRLGADLEEVRARERAAQQYQPRPLSVAVHFFFAREHAERDPLSAWRELLPRAPLLVTQVPGDHISMMKAPHLATLGRAVSDAIGQTTQGSVRAAGIH